MKITSITIRRNRSNPASKFEHRHIEMTATLEEGDSVDDALTLLDNRIAKALLTPEERQFDRLLEDIRNRGDKYAEVTDALLELDAEARVGILPAMKEVAAGGTLKNFYASLRDT